VTLAVPTPEISDDLCVAIAPGSDCEHETLGDGLPGQAVLGNAAVRRGHASRSRPLDGASSMAGVRSNIGRTLVVVATYNEIENLPLLVEEVFRYLPAADLLVVDDNSPDGTGRWCNAKAVEEPRLKCLHRAGKLGLGTAVIAAMKYAIAQGYSYVLTMDADFSHPPKCLPAMMAGMDREGQSVDVMIGSRYVPGGGVEGWPLKRHFMSRGVNFYSRWLLGLPIRDCSGNYRCYRSEVLAKLDFDRIRSRGYSLTEEILWCLKRVGARFGETPIVFVDRRYGKSKINGKEALTALRIIFSLGMQGLFGF
jgi:dolichol-phosphate mannosyltransferase